jgi:hypothetical protein
MAAWQVLLLPLLAKVQARSDADVILLKANLRSFHLAQGVSLKVANPGRRTGRERLRHEAQARSGLRPSANARVPVLMRSVGDEPEGFLAEELVIGRAPTAADIDTEKLAGWLLEFYAANLLRPHPVCALCDPAADWKLLSEYARRVGIAVSPGLETTMLSVIEEAGASNAAAAMCNGDLTLTNMILKDGGLVILDWEYARLAPVFFDAVRLTAQLPDFADRFLAAYNASVLAREPAMLSGRRQFLVACAMAAQQRIDRVEDFEFAGDRAAYDRRLKGRIVKIVALMERLCTGVAG